MSPEPGDIQEPITAELIERSIAAYNFLLSDEQQNNPQRQGLVEDDFVAALKDDAVTKIEVGGALLPVLMPVSANAWYSQSFFENSPTPVWYFGHMPTTASAAEEFEYAMQLAPSIQRLAGEQGLLVFDRQQTDGRKEARIQAILRAADVRFSEQQLGRGGPATQSYFVGSLAFNERGNIKSPPTNLYDAYGELIRDGQYERHPKNGLALVEELSDEEIEVYWKLYDERFRPLSAEHPCEQGMSEDDFRLAMKDPTVMKSVSMRDGKMAALLIMSPNLDNIPWIYPDFYRSHYPGAQVMYFPGFFTVEAMKSAKHGLDVIKIMTDVLVKAGNQILVTFDCCDDTNKIVPSMTLIGIEETGKATIGPGPGQSDFFEPVAVQTYGAYRLAA